jgi:MFS transporter, SHS family, sialic acid transporter
LKRWAIIGGLFGQKCAPSFRFTREFTARGTTRLSYNKSAVQAPGAIEASPTLASRGKWVTLAAAFLGWMFDGFEMGLFPLVGRPALIDLLGDAGQKHVDVWFGLMIAGFLVGAATGGVLFGWLGDRVGRVRAMTLSIFTYAIFMGLCGIAKLPEQVFFFRFISSLGMGGEWSLGVALVMEVWPDQSRGLMAGLIGAASNVGFLAIAAIGLVLNQFLGLTQHALIDLGLSPEWVEKLVAHSGWRLMMLIGAVPALLTFFVQLLVPESKRWQHEKSQGSTAHWASRDLLAVIAGTAGPLVMIFLWVPDRPYPLAVRIAGSLAGIGLAVAGFIFPVFRYLSRASAAGGGQIVAVGPTLRRMLLGACLSGVALVGTWASVQLAPSWASKLVEARRAESKAPAESGGITPASASARTQIVSGLGAILGTMAGALLCNVIGRRPTYTLLCLGSLAVSLAFYLGNSEFGWPLLIGMFFVGGITASFYGWLPLYLPELFPTRMRATGQGFSFNFGRILAAIGALQSGNLMSLSQFGSTKVLSHAHACATMSLVYVIGVGLIWLAPETRGKPLPE